MLNLGTNNRYTRPNKGGNQIDPKFSHYFETSGHDHTYYYHYYYYHYIRFDCSYHHGLCILFMLIKTLAADAKNTNK